MRSLKSLLMGTAALACIGGVSGTANAQSYAFGAGATFPQIVYRQLFDCLYAQAQGSPGKPGPMALAAACTSGGNQSGLGGLILYAPTGSGNGKLTHRTNNKASIGTPSGNVAYTDSNIFVNDRADYDGVQFAGSDDVINSADITAWNAAGNPANFGNIVQLPALIGPVAIGFNGKDGNGNTLNILPATPAGGSSGLNLSRNAVCGIVSGHITKWNNTILTNLNGGVLGTGNITFVHRSDGSGTTFLFANALATQCQFEFGPNNETDATVVSYAMPWTDRAASACPFPVARGANQLNWPDQFTTDQCTPSHPVTNPGGGTFANASGSGNVVALVAATNGAMGYASSDFWLPVQPGGLPTANIQSQWDITASTGQFQPPTPAGAQTAMASAVPQFTSVTRANPLAWSLQGVVANPVVPGAYPITGFTWILMYQCYQVHANGNDAFRWIRTYLDYGYGNETAAAILNANGFAGVPYPWLVEIYTLLNDSANGPNYAGIGGCAGKVGAY